jgi:uncharacterized membrane protein YobD (UPF0266 family)
LLITACSLVFQSLLVLLGLNHDLVDGVAVLTIYLLHMGKNNVYLRSCFLQGRKQLLVQQGEKFTTIFLRLADQHSRMQWANPAAASIGNAD